MHFESGSLIIIIFCKLYDIGEKVDQCRIQNKKQVEDYARASTIHGMGYIEGIYETVCSLTALFFSNILKPYESISECIWNTIVISMFSVFQ